METLKTILLIVFIAVVVSIVGYYIPFKAGCDKMKFFSVSNLPARCLSEYGQK